MYLNLKYCFMFLIILSTSFNISFARFHSEENSAPGDDDTTLEAHNLRKKSIFRNYSPLTEYDLQNIISEPEELTQNKNSHILQTNEDLFHQEPYLWLENTIESYIDQIDTISQCVDDVPSQVEIKQNVFEANTVPKMDELDTFIINKSGCKYRSVQGRSYMETNREKFNGTSFEAHFAIRAPEHALINLWWREFSNQDYLFSVDNSGYKLKQLEKHGVRTLAEKSSSLLSADHYERFYLRLDKETLTFGSECDKEPMFKHKIAIEEGETVCLRFRSDSFYGAKFLYNCPASGAGAELTANNIRKKTNVRSNEWPLPIYNLQYTNSKTKLDQIEIIPKLEEAIHKLFTISENLQTSVDQINQQSDLLVKNTNKSEDNTVRRCIDVVPLEVEIEKDAFRANVKPTMDELDTYIIHKTGCKYEGMLARSYLDANRRYFDGNSFESHFAIRAPEAILINIWWRSFGSQDYLISIGEDGYKLNLLDELGPSTLSKKLTSTNILSADHYEHFYLKLDNGTLRFGRKCEEEPIFKHTVSIEEGEDVWVRLRTDSFYGTRVLYDCPVSGAGGVELRGL